MRKSIQRMLENRKPQLHTLQFRRIRNGLIYFFLIEIVVFLTSLENKEHTGSNE